MKTISFLSLISLSLASQSFVPNPLSPLCASSQYYYDLTRLSCTSCFDHSVAGTDKRSCVCASGYVYADSTLSSCVACPSGKVASFDHTFCLACPASTTSTGGCACAAGEYLSASFIYSSVSEDSNSTGMLTTGICTACPVYAYPSSDLSACISCPDPLNMIAVQSGSTYSCQCLTGRAFQPVPQSGVCLPAASLQSVQQQYSTNPYRVNFLDVVSPSGAATSMGLDSDVFEDGLYKSIVGCNAWNLTYCEQLANLCVLQMYDKTSAACLAYQNIAKSRPLLSADLFDRPKSLPWLYYGLLSREDASTTANKVPDIKVDVSSGSGVSKLPFVLAVYDIEGTFLGLQNLTTNFQYCDGSASLKESWINVGVDFVLKCNINLYNFINATTSTYFYDLFLRETSGSLYPVPVRILNYRSSGNLVNLGSDPADFTNNQLFRRFFTFDKISGVKAGSLSVIRIPTKISFWVIKSYGDSGKIQVPVMDITYSERDVSSISASDNSIYSSPEFIFQSTYNMSLAEFWQTVKIIFAIICVLGVLYAFYLARAWGHRNVGASDVVDIKFLGRVLVFLTGSLGPLVFWFTFAVCLYWYFFYKGQSVLYLVLPNRTEDVTVIILALVAVAVCELIYVTRELVKQCNIDIFIIDWEKSRGKIVSTHEQSPSFAPVSIWRSIFIANQWSALQLARQINIEFTVIWAIVFLQGFNWRYTASSQPNINIMEPTTVNPVLLFAIDTLVWLLIAAFQMIFRTLFYDRFYRNKVLQFVDLLSVANISVLIFDELCHGYYIHGRSVHGSADVNMDDLNHYLRKEESDLVPKRGLQDTNQQGFEIFTTSSFRTTFDKIYSVVASSQNTKTFKVSLRASKDAKTPMQAASEGSIKAYMTINKFLCSLLEKNLKEFLYIIKGKGYFEKMLGANPDLSQGLVFFPDETRFSSVLLKGIEWHILMMHMTIFGLLDIVFDSPIKAGLVVYVLDIVIRASRQHFGQKNVARKTLLDPRFLL